MVQFLPSPYDAAGDTCNGGRSYGACLDSRGAAAKRDGELRQMPDIPERLIIALAVILITLVGYICVAWKLSPLKAMIFGIASIPGAFLAAHAVQYIANMAGSPSWSIVGFGYAMWYWVVGVLWPCAAIAFVIGLLRFGLQLWRLNFRRRASTHF